MQIQQGSSKAAWTTSCGCTSSATLTRERLLSLLGAFFGALALVLATIGLYGSLAFAVLSLLIVAAAAAYLPARRASRIDPATALRYE